VEDAIGVTLGVQVVSVGSVEVRVGAEGVFESGGSGLPRDDLSVGCTEVGLDEHVAGVGEIEGAEVRE
jgi:hypothetical protein